MSLIKTAFLLLLCMVTATIHAQDSTSSDGLFQIARKAAFDQKDYPKAKGYLYRALDISPDYADIRIFLGRIFTWTKNYDSSKICFDYVLNNKPDYEDASIAYTDLEYWNDHYTDALNVCTAGLKYHPQSQDLLLREAKILFASKKYPVADSVIQQLLKLNKNNSEARSLAVRIKEVSYKNQVSLSYDYVYFDKQFADPWHLVSADYGRRTPIGIVTGRINYANRFQENAIQFEADAYPHISKTFYSYVELGYCGKSNGVFPKWRGGASLYANLPKSFEGELGFRYLQFNGSPTWIYTGYIGKYYKSWLFGARTYITPSDYTSTLSASYSLLATYYFGSAEDLIGATIGYGISPDDRYNAIQLGLFNKLTTYKAGLFFKKKISKENVLSATASWYNQEYLPQTIGNQYQIGIQWLHRF
jgi:YaiO family outer membrane protein